MRTLRQVLPVVAEVWHQAGHLAVPVELVLVTLEAVLDCLGHRVDDCGTGYEQADQRKKRGLHSEIECGAERTLADGDVLFLDPEVEEHVGGIRPRRHAHVELRGALAHGQRALFAAPFCRSPQLHGGQGLKQVAREDEGGPGAPQLSGRIRRPSPTRAPPLLHDAARASESAPS